MIGQMRNKSQNRGNDKGVNVYTLKEVGGCTNISIFLVQSPVFVVFLFLFFLLKFFRISKYLQVLELAGLQWTI